MKLTFKSLLLALLYSLCVLLPLQSAQAIDFTIRYVGLGAEQGSSSAGGSTGSIVSQGRSFSLSLNGFGLGQTTLNTDIEVDNLIYNQESSILDLSYTSKNGMIITLGAGVVIDGTSKLQFNGNGYTAQSTGGGSLFTLLGYEFSLGTKSTSSWEILAGARYNRITNKQFQNDSDMSVLDSNIESSTTQLLLGMGHTF